MPGWSLVTGHQLRAIVSNKTRNLFRKHHHPHLPGLYYTTATCFVITISSLKTFILIIQVSMLMMTSILNDHLV